MSTYENMAYSFQDVTANIIGPNISQILTGIAEEGVTVEFEGDKDTQTMGASGGGMHSLRAAQNGTVTIRTMKASPVNQTLANAYNFQAPSAANWGQNTILIEDPVRGDTITCLGCAFRKIPTINFATVAGMQEWVFNATRIEILLGPGVGTTLNG